MSSDPGGNGTLPFEKVPRVHFARLVLLPEAVDRRGNVIQPTLVLATNFDGHLRDHLHDLIWTVDEGLDEVFGHCEQYPLENDRSYSSRLSFLKTHLVKTIAWE